MVTLSPSPPSIEKNRSDGNVSNKELKGIHQAIARSSSPSLCASSPEKETSVLSRPISTKIFYNQQAKNRDNLFSPTKKAKSNDNVNESCSPASSIVALAMSGSETWGQSAVRDFNKKRTEEGNSEHVVSASPQCCDKGRPRPDRSKQGRIEAHSPISSHTESSRIPSSCEMPNATVHKLGPSESNLKRKHDGNRVSPRGSTDQIKRRKAKLVPRKLFSSTAKDSFSGKVSESLSTVSGNELSMTKAQTRDGNSLGVGVMCQQISKEFSRKIETFWTKQMQMFSMYRKNEIKRIQNLQSSLEKNVHQSIDYEEKIFNSEMTLMKERMKSVQENLLKEMQEEELLSVRRGLQSLFMAGARTL
ncbi:Hypothetical predicted protein [Pelobates cultripes]|nr:Hypothetical predicted protein [Pelobates cultripes]